MENCALILFSNLIVYNYFIQNEKAERYTSERGKYFDDN